MKTTIVALNSKYIHSSLGVWYLKAICGEEQGEISVLEATINEDEDRILASIFNEKADVVAFSCYIWNIGEVLKLSENIKKILPTIVIVLGGPEVSFEVDRFLVDHLFVDFVIMGEGEYTFKKLIYYLKSGNINFENIGGLVYRKGNKVEINDSYEQACDLDYLPSPYSDEMLQSIGNRIVYFEASRGCPFSCSYCLSSTSKGVRFFSMERVKNDLDRLIRTGIRQIKFVDRTFNCNKSRAKEILRYVIESSGAKNNEVTTNFHFEAAADLFDEEMLDILSVAPEGLIQLEIGVQSTNSSTLELVDRKTDLAKVFSNISKLRLKGNINIHLDLIAGLPGESFLSFCNSFNQVYMLNPQQLQLGFLKMLKGSKIRSEAELHEYCYRNYPPYEVLFNKFISYEELLVLKGIEEHVDKYYNSGRFLTSLNNFIRFHFETAFEFYRAFHIFYVKEGLNGRNLSSRELYSAFVKFAHNFDNFEIANELIKLDYLASDNSRNYPEGIINYKEHGFKEKCFEFLKVYSNIDNYLPQYKGVPPKEIYKKVHFEVFKIDVSKVQGKKDFQKRRTVIMFDYSSKNKVSGLFRYWKVEI